MAKAAAKKPQAKKTKKAKEAFKQEAPKRYTKEEMIGAFDYALATNDLPKVKQLIASCEANFGDYTVDIRGVGASAHFEGATPLMMAAAYGHEKIVAELIKARAYTELTTMGDNPQTAAQIASTQGHNGVVKMIKAASAKLDDRDREWQQTMQRLDTKLSTPEGYADFMQRSEEEYWRRFRMGG